MLLEYKPESISLAHIYLLSIGGFGPLTKDSVMREATELSKPELEESGSGSLRMLGKLALLWVGSSDWRSGRVRQDALRASN